MCCGQSLKQLTAIGIGGLLTTLGILLEIYWPQIFRDALEGELVLNPKSKSFQMWEETPIPLYVEFYFFNWTNPEDFKKLGSDFENTRRKPNLIELGPYVFREFRKKVVDNWHPHNATITFRQNRTWIFEPTMSNGSLDDVVQTINIPAISAAFACRHLNSYIKLILDQTMQLLDTKYYINKKVGQFLFDGYQDQLLDLAAIVPASLVPLTMPVDRFGWFYKRNGSADVDGIFNMKTGTDNIKNVGKLSLWNYTNQTKMYESYCGQVNGSAGEIFSPVRDRTNITFFSPDICRSLTLQFKKEVTKNGIRGYRYWGNELLFSNQTHCVDNWCWCPAGECPPNGVLDVSTCKFGSPAYVSFPHFLHADPSFRNAVDGMHPEEEKHQMFIDLEPNTGIPLQVAASFQINLLIQPQEGFSVFNEVPKIYFPALWFRQTAQIGDNFNLELKLLVALPTIGVITAYVFIGVGLLIMISTVISMLTINFKQYPDPIETHPVKFLTPLINSPAKKQNIVLQKFKRYE